MGVSSLPKTVTLHRCDCDLKLLRLSPIMLTTRLRHVYYIVYYCVQSIYISSATHWPSGMQAVPFLLHCMHWLTFDVLA